MAKSVNGDPYENLANAIVLKAVEDYRKALKQHSVNPMRRAPEQEIDSLERFFRSRWYSVLTSVDGEYLIRKIRSEYNL